MEPAMTAATNLFTQTLAIKKSPGAAGHPHYSLNLAPNA
jgi:hypothetical protein